MTAREKKKNNCTVMLWATAIFAAAVFIISLIAASVYNTIVTSRVEKNETETVKLYTGNIATYTDSRFDSIISELKGNTVAFRNTDEMTDEEILELLDICADGEYFTSVAYVNKNGRTVISGEMNANPKLYLNDTGSVIPGEYLYSIPIKNSEGITEAALVGIAPENETDSGHSIYGLKGVSFILDNFGNIIFAAPEPTVPLNVGDNVLTILGNENNMNSLKSKITRRDVCEAEIVNYKGERYILAVSSLKTEKWSLIALVPCSAVYNYSESVTSPMNYFIFGLTAVFLILAGYLFYFASRAHKRANAFIDENNKINYIDDITGYSSWKHFMEEYDKKRVDTSTKYAFIFLDIDKFKTVNDTIGFEGGNEVLKKVSEIIANDIGENDIFARNGGDHFCMLAEYNSEDDIVNIVNNIIADIEYRITEIKITVSIGIYLITDHNMKIRAAADRANIARSTIKNFSESAYVFFDTNMLDNIREEKSIENIMEEALEKGEFVVYLQPKYDLDDSGGEVIGAEALVRWYHDGEIMQPGKFIPIFEKNGFVTKLDFYMFREVCKLQKSWQNMGYTPKVISVNMSRLHFPNPDFVDTLINYCREFDIDPKYFEIEVTESAAYENISILMSVFSKIKEAGFHVSIDDFGTGYSSLNMLKDLPVDVLKIDRSFLTENADEAENASKIIACVVSLASSLDISTICEGIETKEQANLLSKLGCDMAQGFYFARPMPVKEFEKLVYGIE